MTYGVIQIGRIAVREDSAVDVSIGETGATVELSGQESYGRLSLAQLRQRADEILALAGTMVPVSFTQKAHLNGYYWVHEASGRYEEWQPEGVAALPWKIRLTRIGYATDTDLESRLSGPLTQATDHAVVGERWHAPPVGHMSYSAGSSVPSVVLRTGGEGAVVVYRNIDAETHPRWSSSTQGYALGRCRFIDDGGAERQAVRAPFAVTGWQMHNTLVKVSVDPVTSALDVASWTGGAWQSMLWNVVYGTGPAVALGVPTAVSLLRNTYERATLRLVKSLNPGRITVDITLRRGSRWVELYVQHQFGTTLAVRRQAAEAGTANTGYVLATVANAAGNQYVVGSARTFTADTVQGGLSRAATSTLDAFIGVQVSGAVAGDTGAEALKQYLGAPEEIVQGVRR